jgi:putative protein-disulfide isomerase
MCGKEKKFHLIYCYDAYCGWCYGFSPVMKKIAKQYKDDFYVEVLSGGMIRPDTPQPIGLTAPYIREACKTVSAYTGIVFGADYLWHIDHPEQSDWFPDSLQPAIALSVLKTAYPEKALDFATDLQYALHFEGRDLTDDEAYRHLLPLYNLEAAAFYRDLHSPVFLEKARYDFALVKQLQVSSFPTVLLQASEQKFYLVTKGYTDLETMQTRLDQILKEIKPL